MEYPLISIIVPVYNVERYLRECLDSIVGQSYTNWELLLIDDGSSDNSGTICDEYSKRDTRVKVIHKSNGGVSSARNLGLQESNGKWLIFVDSDDFISPTFIEGMLKPAITNPDLDLVLGGCTNWKNGQPVGVNQYYDDYIGFEPDIIFEKFRGLIVSKLFRLENIRTWSNGFSLYFDEKMKIAEDMAFTLDYLQTVSKFAFVSEVGYFYRLDNLSSATHLYRLNNFDEELHKFNHLYNSIMEYINKHSLTQDQSKLRLNQIAKGLLSVFDALYYENKSFNRKKTIISDMLIKYDYLLDYIRQEDKVGIELWLLSHQKLTLHGIYKTYLHILLKFKLLIKHLILR